MFNTLMYAKKLEEAGFSRQQAEVNVQIMAEIIGDGMVTKEDLREALRQFGTQLEYRLTIKLGTLLVIGFTTMATLLKFWIIH